jgi:hypothetical protein
MPVFGSSFNDGSKIHCQQFPVTRYQGIGMSLDGEIDKHLVVLIPAF